MESFEEMFEESLKAIKPKSVIKGEVIAVSEDEMFVNIGYKADGIITRKEFSYDEDVNVKEKYKIGDVIDVFVMNLNDGKGNVELSIKRVNPDNSKEEFDNIFESGSIIEAKVSQVLEKGIRAKYKSIEIFIPGSQLVNKIDTYKDQKISIKIIENKRNRVIGSEKMATNEVRASKAKETLSKIAIGDKVKGTVKRINEYGAFVDIGGIEGLLHVSQMTWQRNANPKDFVKEGQELEIEIIEFDKENNKIGLRIKKEEENPWNKVGTEVVVGNVYTVKVLRIVPFGVFVEIIDNIEGFIHISQICEKRINNPSEELQVGQEVEAKIIKIDSENKRIELTIRGINDVLVSEAEKVESAN